VKNGMKKAASPAVLALVLVSGCVVNGNFKYKATRVEVETVDLAGIEAVEFNLGSEDVVIKTAETRQAEFTIEKTVRAVEKKYAEDLLDEAEMLFERHGDKLVVKRKKDKSMGVSGVTKGRVSIDIEVGLPAALGLEINTGSGDVEVADREGMLTINTGSGDVETGAAASGLNVCTGSGDMAIDAARYDVQLSAGSGDISVGGLGGKARIGTGSGDVRVRKVTGDVVLSTGSGDIRIDRSVGALSAGTGSGDVDLLHHTGGADINTASGDVMLGIDGGEGDIAVTTSSGEVDIVIYGGDAYEVEIGTDSGSISSRVPLTVREASRKKLSGRYGEGGFSLRVSTSSGAVSLARGAI